MRARVGTQPRGFSARQRGGAGRRLQLRCDSWRRQVPECRRLLIRPGRRRSGSRAVLAAALARPARAAPAPPAELALNLVQGHCSVSVNSCCCCHPAAAVHRPQALRAARGRPAPRSAPARRAPCAGAASLAYPPRISSAHLYLRLPQERPGTCFAQQWQLERASPSSSF